MWESPRLDSAEGSRRQSTVDILPRVPASPPTTTTSATGSGGFATPTRVTRRLSPPASLAKHSPAGGGGRHGGGLGASGAGPAGLGGGLTGGPSGLGTLPSMAPSKSAPSLCRERPGSGSRGGAGAHHTWTGDSGSNHVPAQQGGDSIGGFSSGPMRPNTSSSAATSGVVAVEEPRRTATLVSEISKLRAADLRASAEDSTAGPKSTRSNASSAAGLESVNDAGSRPQSPRPAVSAVASGGSAGTPAALDPRAAYGPWSAPSLSRTDIQALLRTLSNEEREELDLPSFYEDCREKFHQLDVDSSGFLEEVELRSDTLAEILSALEFADATLDGGHHAVPQPSSSLSSTALCLFDADQDGRLCPDEFYELARCCHVLRLRGEQAAARGPHSSVGGIAAGTERPAPQQANVAGSRRMQGGYSKTHPQAARPPTMPGSHNSLPLPTVAAPRRTSETRSKSTGEALLEASREQDVAHTSKRRSSSQQAPSALLSNEALSNARGSSAEERGVWHTPLVRNSPMDSPSSKRRGRRTASKGSSRGSSRASSRHSSRNSSKGSREPFRPWRDNQGRPWEEFQVLQREAMLALLSHLRSSGTRTLRDTCNILVQRVMNRDGTPAFSKPTVSQAVTQVLNGGSGSWGVSPAPSLSQPASSSSLGSDRSADEGEPLPARRAVEDVESTSGPARQAWAAPTRRQAGSLPRPPKARENSGGSGAADEATAPAVLQVLRLLGQDSELSVSDIIGQVLWQHRRAEALKSSRKHKATVESLSWVAADTEPVENVFRLFAGESARMSRAQWARVVQLMKQNAVLGARVRTNDADRVFYSSMNRNTDSVRGVSLREFLRLLVALAESIGAHPWMVFNAVGCHADSLAIEAAAGRPLLGEGRRE